MFCWPFAESTNGFLYIILIVILSYVLVTVPRFSNVPIKQNIECPSHEPMVDCTTFDVPFWPLRLRLKRMTPKDS